MPGSHSQQTNYGGGARDNPVGAIRHSSARCFELRDIERCFAVSFTPGIRTRARFTQRSRRRLDARFVQDERVAA